MAVKQRGEREVLSADEARAWRGRLTDAIASVDAEAACSVLPEEPSATALSAADRWLRDLRRSYFGRG